MKKRVLYYDILNICACIAVIAMHCNGLVHSYSNCRAWKEALVVEVTAYWAVPVFFMLSGAKLLSYRRKYDTSTFLVRRVSKVAIPWISWCIIWFLINIFIFKSIQINSISDVIANLYNGIFNNGLQTIYWFFIPMIMIYFCIPILSCLTDKREMLWYIVTISFITYSILPELCSIFKIGYNPAWYYPLGGGYILFVVLGYLLSTMSESDKVRHFIYLAGLASVVIRYAGTLYLSVKNNMKDTTYWGDHYFTSVFLAVAVFLFFKQRKYKKIQQSERLIAFIQYLAGCSFGIYLFHNMVITFFITGVGVDSSSLWWRTLGIGIVYILSLLGVSVLKKIPILCDLLVP